MVFRSDLSSIAWNIVFFLKKKKKKEKWAPDANKIWKNEPFSMIESYVSTIKGIQWVHPYPLLYLICNTICLKHHLFCFRDQPTVL
jgi:hypothetical protein